MNSLRHRGWNQVHCRQLYSQYYNKVRGPFLIFFLKLGALIITGLMFGLIAGMVTLDPYLATGVFLLWAVLNKKTVMKEGDANAQD